MVLGDLSHSLPLISDFRDQNEVGIINDALGSNFTLESINKKDTDYRRCIYFKLDEMTVLVQRTNHFAQLVLPITNKKNKCAPFRFWGHTKLFFRLYHLIMPSQDTPALFSLIRKICTFVACVFGFIADLFFFILCLPINIPLALINVIRNKVFLRKDLEELRCFLNEIRQNQIDTTTQIESIRYKELMSEKPPRRTLADSRRSISSLMSSTGLTRSELQAAFESFASDEDEPETGQLEHKDNQDHHSSARSPVLSPPHRLSPRTVVREEPLQVLSGSSDLSVEVDKGQPKPALGESFLLVDRERRPPPNTREVVRSTALEAEQSFFLLIRAIRQMIDKSINKNTIQRHTEQKFGGTKFPKFLDYQIKLAIMLAFELPETSEEDLFTIWGEKLNHVSLIINQFDLVFRNQALAAHVKKHQAEYMKEEANVIKIRAIFEYLHRQLKTSGNFDFKFILLSQPFERVRGRKKIFFALDVYQNHIYDFSAEISLFFTQEQGKATIQISYDWFFPTERESDEERLHFP